MLNATQNVLDRLAAADRAHQKEAGGSLLLRGVKYGCAAILAGFVLDVVFHLGAGWRLSLLLALIGAAAGLAAFCVHLAFVRRNRAEHTARVLETRDPALGSQLINLLQLKEQGRDEKLAPRTRDLAGVAVEHYATQLSAAPLENLARTDEVPRQLKRAAWALLIFAAILASCFRITAVEIARFVDPFGDHPPYSFTHLEIVDPGAEGAKVVYGKGVIVKVKASGHQPKEIFISSFPPGHPEQVVTVPMFDEGGAGFNQSLDNIRTDLVVYAHTKDHVSESKQVRVAVELTPKLEKTFVRIAPPSYTGLKPEEKAYDFKAVQALEGSTVQFRLQSNRPLHDGWLEVTAGEKAPLKVTLIKSAENEVTGSFVAAESGRLRLGVTDIDRLTSQGANESGLTVTYDLPPDVHIVNPPHDSFVAMDFKLQAQAEANDDYGLTEIRLHVGINGVYGAPKVFKYDKIVLNARATSDLSFAEMGVHANDVVTLFAEAIDNAPQPHLSRSQTVQLKVISVEDYNNYLRELSDITKTKDKYADLNNDLRKLLDQQKALGEAEQKLSEELAKADPQQKKALEQQFDKLVAQQNELNQKLNRQAERMENFVRQTPLYDVEKELQDVLREKAKAIRESTQANDATTHDVAQRSSPPSGPRQLAPDMADQLKQASNDQVAKLDKAHAQTEEEVVKPLEDMSKMQALVNDFNYFESLYKKQVELAQHAQAYNREGQLDRTDQLALKDLAADEKAMGDAFDALQNRLVDDAKAAEETFPKAAESAKSLSRQISGHRLQPLAMDATDQMLAGTGDQSFQIADRLRGEMEKLFSECHGGNCPGSNELDTYLQLKHISPGSNFSQMSRSRHFGIGQGKGTGSSGQGQGQDGTAGYAITGDVNMSVLGNETFASEQASRQSTRNGKGSSTLISANAGQPGTPDVINGLNPVNRHSAANSSEAVVEEYNDVVENYFKAIAAKKDVHEKSN